MRLTTALFLVILRASRACLPPPPVFYFGPIFGAPLDSLFFPPTTPNVITTTDPNLLAGVLRIYSEASSSEFDELNVTINLSDLTVTSGWPETAELLPVPPETENPTGGFVRSLDGTTMSITNVVTGARFDVNLELPPFFELLSLDNFGGDPTFAIPFFVSRNIEKAFIMYEASIDCADPAVFSDRCTNCADCEQSASFVTIVDLESGDQRTQETPFLRSALNPPGGQPIFPISGEQFRPLWDDIQIVDSNVFDSVCPIPVLGYFFYDESGLQPIARGFNRRSLFSLIPGDLENPTDRQGYRVATVRETLPSADTPLPTQYSRGFAIERYSLFTGETLETFQLDAQQIWALAELEMPMLITDEPTNAPTFATNEPTSMVPTTTEPTTTAPVMLPTRPVPTTRAPFPTIPIAFPRPVAPVPTTRAPFPTIPIAFPRPEAPTTRPPITVEPPTRPVLTTLAPFPTIPIAFPRPVAPVPTTFAPFPTIPIAFGPTTLAPFPTIPIAFPRQQANDDSNEEYPYRG